MSVLDVMQAYFRGEKLEAMLFILPLGVLLVAFGGVALKVERGGFAWGIAIPCFLFGLVLIATGSVIAWRTEGQVADLASRFEEAPAAMVEQELPRIRRVNANFRTTFVGFGVAAALGVGLIFVVGTGWAQGLGSALVLLAAIGFLVDGFASRRALPYTAALVTLAEQLPPSVQSDP